MHVKRLFVFICLLFVVGVSQAQRFGLSAGLGYLTTRMYDKDQPNYVVELSGACHLTGTFTPYLPWQAMISN